MTISVLAAISSFKEQAPEAGGCAAEDRGDMGDKGDRGDMGHRRHREKGDPGATGLNGSTVLGHEIKPKMGEIS